MLTYERVYEELLNALEDAGLEIFDVQNFMEMGTCLKEFRCFCVPRGTPVPHEIKAEMAFLWDAVLTAEAVYGGNCSLYHDEHSYCTHKDLRPETYIELEIKYFFKAQNFETAGALARSVQTLIASQMDHQNYPEVKYELLVQPDQSVAIAQAYAFHWWELSLGGDKLQVAGIAREVHRVMQAMLRSGLF